MNNFERWILSWIGLFESMVGILTLGIFLPSWELNFCFWHSKNYAKKSKEKKK